MATHRPLTADKLEHTVVKLRQAPISPADHITPRPDSTDRRGEHTTRRDHKAVNMADHKEDMDSRANMVASLTRRLDTISRPLIITDSKANSISMASTDTKVPNIRVVIREVTVSLHHTEDLSLANTVMSPRSMVDMVVVAAAAAAAAAADMVKAVDMEDNTAEAMEVVDRRLQVGKVAIKTVE